MAATKTLLLVLLLTILSLVSAQNTTAPTTPPPSFCETCRDKGQCQQAYQGNPRIFCGSWLSATSQRLACCCPADAVCKKSDSNYKCECGKRKSESKKSVASSLNAAVAAVGVLATNMALLA